jgi:hypothetical protein
MAIDKLSKHPFSDVSEWLYEEKVEQKKDPGLPKRPSNIRIDKKAHMPVPKLQEVLLGLISKVNQIITEVSKIQELEKLVNEIDQDLSILETTFNSHANKLGGPGGHMTGGNPGSTNTTGP